MSRPIDSDILKKNIEKYRTSHLSHVRLPAIKREAKEVINDICFAIDCAPTVQSEPKWIPVSERLPEEGVQVLVTDDAGGLATIDVDCGYFDEEYGRFEWFHSQNVTAWMPLPEPWKGEK